MKSKQKALESILFVLTEGCSWRAIDRPQARWNSVYQYFRRWCQRGVLKKVLTQFGPELAPGWHFVDSTHVKVHADGSNPAGGQALQAMGRTKGGLNTKIHALVNVRSQALVIALSGGNQADISLADELTECLPEGSTLIGDKAYDSSTLRQTAATKGIKTCIPARTNRTTTVPFSATVYRRRHRVENFFERIKRYRRVATRYDKLAETFLGFVCLAILFTLRLK
jgi:transposase